MYSIKIDNFQIKKSKNGRWYGVVESRDLPDGKATTWERDVINALKFAFQNKKVVSLEMTQNQNGYWNITKVFSVPNEYQDEQAWGRGNDERNKQILWQVSGKIAAQLNPKDFEEWKKLTRDVFEFLNNPDDGDDEYLTDYGEKSIDKPVDYNNPVPEDEPPF